MIRLGADRDRVATLVSSFPNFRIRNEIMKLQTIFRIATAAMLSAYPLAAQDEPSEDVYELTPITVTTQKLNRSLFDEVYLHSNASNLDGGSIGVVGDRRLVGAESVARF